MRKVSTLSPADISDFIAANLPLAPVVGVPEIVLHQAAPTSGLWRLGGADTPFWAYPWAGGLALARYVLDHPDTVAGKSVLDLGAGSGLVGIAAAKAGAAHVITADVDANAMAAAALNARANGVALSCVLGDVSAGPPPDVDVILAGDVFYDRALAKRMLPFLQICAANGAAVFIGDPNRAPLPRAKLKRLAHYETGDVGDALRTTSYVYALRG